MIPQIAQHPRHVSQQFGSPGFAVPPFEPLPSPSRHNQPATLPFRRLQEFAPFAPTQPQRAYPLDSHVPRRTGLARGSSSEQGVESQYNDPSEHMLRRKTPNGTLAAGYDGTPVQWSSKPPALKHVILPFSEHSSTSRSNIYSPTSSKQSNLRTGSLGWEHQQSNQYAGNAMDGEQRGAGEADRWTRLPPVLNGSHNVWDHLGMQQAPPYYTNNGAHIPTVLQPAFQPSPGPTASNDGGLYGPYWPDGKFVPYRPAAFRGQANHYSVPESFLNRTLQNHIQPPGDLLTPIQQSSASLEFDPIMRAGNPSFHFQDPGAPLIEHRFQMPLQPPPFHIDTSHYLPSSEGSRTPTAESVNKASNLQFKEKTLSRAHSVYVDLLAFLHQSKKDNRNSNGSLGSRSYSKTSIYPKPPRQPTSYLGTSQWAAQNSELSETSGSPRHISTMSRPTFQRSASSDQSAWRGSSIGETRQPLTPSGQYTSPFQTSHYPATNPLTKAKEALELLTNLCEQSGWCWIDGMLLGGCLAYGLEQYHNALDWYSKIIALDPMWVNVFSIMYIANSVLRHVEAISNLAATLLCLNRREEAEQHWLQSVKLRPSYFEAVEHLIGLLCGDHRGNEAVGIIDFVERSLRLPKREESSDYFSETSSNADRESCESVGTMSEIIALDYDGDNENSLRSPSVRDNEDSFMQQGFGSSGFSVPGSENGRILALVHAKGNMLYALGDVNGASKAFEDAVLISSGRGLPSIHGLIRKILNVLSSDGLTAPRSDSRSPSSNVGSSPLLLIPTKALQTAKLVFAKDGELPGLRHVPDGLAKKAAVSTTSNSLLSLAKIFQDAMSNSSSPQRISRMPAGVGDILALYYLSLSLQPSPSTANNVGILLASVQQPASHRQIVQRDGIKLPAGVVPGSGVALALAYYNYGLNLDARHAHIYTNLGSLLKDIGQLSSAITMYEKAVACDSSFDIALANLANAVKDQGRTSDAIEYYRRAVASSPDFAEAVCGLANALNSVCDWAGRGGVILDGGMQDRWHVDETGMITEARTNGSGGGWMKRVVDIVAKQLKDGSAWGRGTLQGPVLPQILQHLEAADTGGRWTPEKGANMHSTLSAWAGHRWEGSRIVRLIERATKRAMLRWYQDKHVKKRLLPPSCYPRPLLPSSLSVPTAPTVLPFHTFTCPLSAKDIRMISQRNALRISCSTLRSPWMPVTVFPPPSPPAPQLNIGYVSSDFNNHPLAHLMQSVFGFHNPSRARAFCYATTASDNSVHRQQIEREAPVFRDVSTWSADRLVQQIVQDEIHILVNLNGYTRGARNEVFAARPAPIQMSFMGFAGTLGAEWCDYILADETAIPPDTLRPWRRNLTLEDQLLDQRALEEENWVYSENIIFCRETFFCCDHAQSESRESQSTWEDEQSKRWEMRKELFPSLSDDAIILGNFNQLYKIEPTTFRTWLRILDNVPKAILWLLRFPDLGESNLKRTAQEWAGESVASRIWFTDVAPKHQHISRARVCDLFLDTPECNAHTTAADVLWSSTPLLTLPRYKYKMCSRMAASILKGALPRTEEGHRAAKELIAEDDEQYEEFAIRLARGFSYRILPSGRGEGVGRLGELRKLLFDSRWTCALFDTKRWVSDLESAYDEAWRRWVSNEGGDIYL
ncbi:putative UDP-N-acetylglucosamine--peptide N-acetylglucosaminyltransferase SEC [Lachnellula suecica]|uniref:protein O-GlcNAc transferase n=1 Tax=Lachnellula suecica TaxID=602035 RepID=A0A8T9CSJ3_9HELO|nr:putative UDP-N-acetylglucosamine--peptide N-acetylglucosaminyltransferase SEC [Lachnellula suecica]